MQLTAGDFRRWLPGAALPLVVEGEGDSLIVSGEGLLLRVTLAPLPPRRIALITLPLLRVTMDFAEGWDAASRAAFLKRFDDRFRRGGG